MIESIHSVLGIGVEPKNLDALQVSTRAVLVFVTSIVMVRVGDRRFLSQKTAFDAVLGFTLASMLARTINGSSPLLPLAGGFLIVLFHRVLAMLSARWHLLGKLVKGNSDLIIKDGQFVGRGMEASSLSLRDIEEVLRLSGVADISEVALGYMERNGEISVVKKAK
jgi:uncharacterized membrane protein YcaP (DUF421 family)